MSETLSIDLNDQNLISISPLVKVLEDVIVCYDGTVRNSLGDLIQFNYGKDGKDGAFIEKQSIKTFGLSNKEFEHNYRVDATDPAGGFMANVLQAAIDDSSLELQAKLDEEYRRLVDDRKLLREFFPRVPTNSPITYPSILAKRHSNLPYRSLQTKRP